MLKKLKELFGFPTEAEKAAAKTDTDQPKLFVDGHGDVREVKPAVDTSGTGPFPFPTSDKPEAEIKAPTKKPRVVKPKTETAPAKKPAAKKPAAKKPAAKKPAAKKPAAKKPTTRRAKTPVVGSVDTKQN